MELLKILATSNSIVEIRKRSKGKIIVLSLGAVMLSLASGIDIAKAESSPTTTFVTFESVKKFLSDVHQDIGHTKTLYCDCSYVRKGKSGGDIDRETCGLKARKNETRSDRVEWEHVVPASWFGNKHLCWKQGHKLCKTKRGKTFKGRKCCLKSGVDSHFRKMHDDPHNLFPAGGEINGDRLNYPFGTVEGELREYGACDFEVGGDPRVAEPTTSVRGEIARAMLYMKDTYKVDIKKKEEETLKSWHADDPPSQWECNRAQKIKDRTNLEGYGFEKCGTDASVNR